MQGVKTRGGLPQPYYMKPKSNGVLTTPMKKLLAYLFVLFIFGFLIFEITPKPKTEDTKYELDHGNQELNDPAAAVGQAAVAVGAGAGAEVDAGDEVNAGVAAGDIQEKKNIISDKKLKEKLNELGDIDIAEAHADTNHEIVNNANN